MVLLQSQGKETGEQDDVAIVSVSDISQKSPVKMRSSSVIMHRQLSRGMSVMSAHSEQAGKDEEVSWMWKLVNFIKQH